MSEDMIKDIPEDTPEGEPAPDAPPKLGRPTTRAGRRARAEAAKAKAERQPKPTAPKPKQKPLADRIESFYVSLGIGVSLALGQADGLAITSGARQCAEAWDKAARSNARIAEAWEKILSVSVMGELVMAHAPILLTIGANHGVVPPATLAMMGLGDQVTPDPATAPAPPPSQAETVPSWLGASA